jgi:hypothetical protein
VLFSASQTHFGLPVLLLIFGGFCLFAAVAMWMRTRYASSYDKPDPYLPPGMKPRPVGWWGRGELRRVPLYKGMSIFFVILGVALLFGAGIAGIVSLF